MVYEILSFFIPSFSRKSSFSYNNYIKNYHIWQKNAAKICQQWQKNAKQSINKYKN
jgi:hypothetical protein